MKKLSYPIKFLLLVTVFSLLPVAVGVSPLDYKGSSLEAADEEKKKKKRRRTKLPSKKMQRILQNLVPLIEVEQWDEALLALEPVAAVDSKFTSTDRSKMFYYRGYIYFSQEKYDLAERAYKDLIAEPDSNDQERQGALFSLSQLSYIAEEYQRAINYLLEWLEGEEEPSSDAYALIAQAYYQIEDYRKSVEAIDISIDIQESRDIAIKEPVLDEEGNETGEMIATGETVKGVAKENHYLLKMALYSELKMDLEVYLFMKY
jgi:tetratricopeptide (TPR) repeat protein